MCMKIPSASSSLRATICFQPLRAIASAASCARVSSASLQPWYEPTTRPTTGSQPPSAVSTGPVR